ncbi:hypothetical protein L2E82_53893 [Cichorium intybus]|nr:hypothetical protein L2E82_53893 [Cichorium intybus]
MVKRKPSHMEELIPTKYLPDERNSETSKSIILGGEEINETTVLLREKLVGESEKKIEDPSKTDPTHGSPILSPNMKKLNIHYGQPVELSLEKSQSAIIKEQNNNTPKQKEVSAKLKKLLSRNLSIAEKLEDGDESKTNKNKDSTGMAKLAKTEGTTKNKQNQFEQRITRSQLRRIEENTKRKTRANSRNNYSRSSSMSVMLD